MKMRANYILVDPEPWTTAKLGSIVLPDNQTIKASFDKGTVIEKGPGLYLSNGEQIAIEVDQGDRVLYFKKGAAPIIVNGKEMHIIQEREILAILEPGDFGTLNDETEGESNATD